MAQPLELVDMGSPPLERMQLLGAACHGAAGAESRTDSQFLSPMAGAFLEMTVSLFFLGQHESVWLVLWTLPTPLAGKRCTAGLALTGAKFQL